MIEKVEVLVATMHQNDEHLLEKMNIQTDAIVGNQCDINEIKSFVWRKHTVKWLSFNEHGVGLNRNNTLMRATGDICIFADDDMIYVDGYADIVRRAFKEIPEADVIIFNLIEPIPKRYIIPKIKKVTWMNYLRYGTARIAVRLAPVRLNGIFFNLCFGGGTEYSHGEDNLFLTDCLRKGLKIYAYPEYIARLTEERESTCNRGSLEKSLRDQGALFYQISHRFWHLLCLQHIIRHGKMYDMNWIKAYLKMVKR